jgi:enoyl-CoA hydratase
MPEVGIGFIPDVGGTFLLANAPGCLGFHAALTACRLSAADALLYSLADFYIPAERLANIAASLAHCPDATSLQALLQANTQPALPSALDAARRWINTVYAHPTLEAIVAAMQSCEECDARMARQEIEGKSPTSLKVTLRLLQEARGSTQLRSCLQREYDAARVCIRNHDFVEGVRAAVVDKDRTPRWSPATLADVTSRQVDMYFRNSPDTALF